MFKLLELLSTCSINYFEYYMQEYSETLMLIEMHKSIVFLLFSMEMGAFEHTQ